MTTGTNRVRPKLNLESPSNCGFLVDLAWLLGATSTNRGKEFPVQAGKSPKLQGGPRFVRAVEMSGFTTVLHTWSQRLYFHPHLHCIVPGAGISAACRVILVQNANFLVPQPALRNLFRAHGDVMQLETLTGGEFVKRYLRHVLPRGLRAVRHHGFCHPAAKAKRERIAFHIGCPLLIGAAPMAIQKPPHIVICSCCGEPMKKLFCLLPAWRSGCGPPIRKRTCA
jgi:hypothetical protein